MREEYWQAIEETLHRLAFGVGERRPETLLGECAPVGDTEIPQPLGAAMAYSLWLPAKRLRPMLLLAAYRLLREDWREALPFAAGLEMIHTYSLIHDDLPTLDDDSLRRGKPTNHTVFGEDMALLAGDGLLNYAYETMLAAPLCAREPARALRAIGCIARRAGVRGMIAGQTLDVRLEGAPPTEASVRYIHRHKTADLFIAPMEAGLTLAGASEAQLAAGREYGESLGVAFQIIDDLLDIGGDERKLGKLTGKDALIGKQTWPAVFGAARARADAAERIDRAVRALNQFDDSANFLREIAHQSLVRES